MVEHNGAVTFQRYVAIGDSFTEGVGDVDPERPNGVRGWADRVAEVLAQETAAAGGELGYANLAVRGRQLDQVLAEQLEPALAMRPDLVTVYAGGNDIMRPRVDIDNLVERYDAALGTLAASGARLLVFTAFDTGGSAIWAPIRGRFAIYNELLRPVVARHGATVVDFWALHELRDWRYWDVDRMHLNSAGHQRIAREVLDVLGVPHQLRPGPLAELAALRRRQQLREDLLWVRQHLAPWVHRRVTGRSSGDVVTARRPRLAPAPSPSPAPGTISEAREGMRM